MRELTEHDQKDDQTGDPRVELVGMHDFVAENGNEPCCCSDYYDTSIARDISVNGVEKLSADYNIHSGPAYTGEDVEDCNYGWGINYLGSDGEERGFAY